MSEGESIPANEAESEGILRTKALFERPDVCDYDIKWS
jgi:hypothetical protein